MNRGNRHRFHPADLVSLESRQLLTANQILGNTGEIILSQFQPFGFSTAVGSQLEGVRAGGPFKVDLAATSSTLPFPIAPVVNSGLVQKSQFNGAGFQTVGLQLRDVRLGRGLSVSGSDNENEGIPPSFPVIHGLPNRNVITNSQFNDGGFGTLGIGTDGRGVGREGRVGLQWTHVQIRKGVDIALENDIIQPGARPLAVAPATSSVSGIAALGSNPGQTVIDFSGNSGLIHNSQINDGGFGDIGFQWSSVKVGGGVGTTTNTLFINPSQDNYGPITIKNRVLGRAGNSVEAGSRSNLVGAPSEISAQALPYLMTYTNSATNSGKIINSQVNDGGFGDVGLQWKNVKVSGSVAASHNSLTVQPENNGQGLITVEGVTFPNAPTPTPIPTPTPEQWLPTNPPAVAQAGDPVANLPKPTGPLSPYFPVPFAGPGTVTLPFPGNYPLVNAASNSGFIKDSQFNAGGFGDLGLQWQKVNVRGNVNIVHNSLSVHPEGSKLTGISVTDVSYGPPIPKSASRYLAVLPFAVISPGDITTASRTNAAQTPRILTPPNNRILTNQQVATPTGTDLFLQWNGIEHHHGLIVVHNIIQLTGVGPQTGTITLSNIRFPYRVPNFAPLSTRPTIAAASVSPPTTTPLLNSSNNSGVIRHAQFNDGGFGDVGIQWRNVSVESVDVVHNTLSVDATADLPAGDVSGPIAISNISFNSEALKSDIFPKTNQKIISPPDVIQHVSSRGVNLGKALPMNPTVRNDTSNSGILRGGQLAAGAANHAMLQWQCVKLNGKVRVIDNVLSISVLDRPSGPITISNVTFD